MALHEESYKQVEESLDEMLFAARYMVTYTKDKTWGDNQERGCLGYPAAIILFCIADSLGKYLESGDFGLEPSKL